VNELAWKDGIELAGLIKRREVSPVEVLDQVLAQLEATEPRINAFVTVVAERARDAAEVAEQTLMRGPIDELGPLHGVPISIKDLSDTAGVRTTYGSVAFADNVPDRNTTTVSRLLNAGAILYGKTTTPEFGALGTTESGLTGITENPWRLGFIAGGSSGGAAASVAAGVGALAWGSDGGGSVRIPAACCGVVGLKASRGRIPGEFAWDSASTDGPLTRSVIDSALLLQITAGPSPADPLSLPPATDDYLAAVRAAGDVRGLRIAYAPRPAGHPVAPEVDAAVRATLATLEAAGAIVDEVELPLPDPVQYFLDFWGPGIAGLSEILGGELPHPVMRDIARRAGGAEAYYRAATQTRGEITKVYNAVLADHDIIVTPTMPVAPFRHPGAVGGPTQIEGVTIEVPGVDFHVFTESPSHAGLPAITVPSGFSAEGLPIGMQIIATYFRDDVVLRAAADIELLAPWSSHRPEFRVD